MKKEKRKRKTKADTKTDEYMNRVTLLRTYIKIQLIANIQQDSCQLEGNEVSNKFISLEKCNEPIETKVKEQIVEPVTF